jgi:hypothetical protein
LIKIPYILVFLIALVMAGPLPVFGDQVTSTSPDKKGTAATENIEAATDEEDDVSSASESKKKKTKDPDRGRILPIPIFITEPAVGEGFGLVLAYFHRVKGRPDKRLIGSPDSIADTREEQAPPPTVTGVFGAYTSNETAVAGVGHMNTFKDDRIRFTAVAAVADINSTFYLNDQPFKFNLEGAFVFQETRFRFGDSRWFWGIGLSYLDASSAFRVDLPEDPLPFLDLFRADVSNVGLAAKLSWDTRDSTSMPGKGKYFDFAAWRYDDLIGGDYDYWDARLKFHSFHPLHEKFVLGWRAEYSTINGHAPFFAIPFVKLRGIPALRYQGEHVGVFELEGRYNFTPRWAMIGFAGKGWTSSYLDFIDTDQNIRAYGLGGRYKIFEAQNIWVGIDIAKGPEDYAWYIQVGQAW